jgi:hypothetical protein
VAEEHNADAAPFDLDATMRRLAQKYIRVHLSRDENNREYVAWVRYGRPKDRGRGRSIEDAFADLERALARELGTGEPPGGSTV